MKIIINKGQVYLSDIDNDELVIVTDREITSFNFDTKRDVLGDSRIFHIAEIVAWENTDKMVEELKGGKGNGR